MSFVNASIVGNVVKDPVSKTFSTGRKVTTLVVAVNTRPRPSGAGGGGAPENEQTDFYKVEVWGNLADVASAYVYKGNQITAAGRLTIDRWQDREGRDRFTPIITANQFSLPPRSPSHSLSTTSSIHDTTSNTTDTSIDDFQMTEEEEAAAAEGLFGTKS